MKLPLMHPSEDRLLDYALGHGDRGLRVILETHLAGCDTCAAKVAEVSSAGGSLVAEQTSDPLPAELWDRILAQVAVEAVPAAMLDDLQLPLALRALVPPPAEQQWSSVLKKGIRFLRLLNEAGTELFLVRLEPGAAFPHHVHGQGGREIALMLQGGAIVGGRTFEAGDWVEFPGGSAHAPAALPDEPCWILAQVQGEVQLSGWRGLLQRLVK
jgi:putative transcriptional regulator